jgi:hypothetical protein
MTPASPKIKTTARVSPYRLAHSLRGWARGSDSTQAPVELLIRSFGGTFPNLSSLASWLTGQVRSCSTPKSSPKAL